MELQKVQRTTLTMKEAAEYLGISYWLANQLVRRKQIPCSKIGGKFLFRVQALDEYLTKKEIDSFKLYYLKDLSIKDIAIKLDSSCSNIKYYLYNARRKIKEKYDD